MTRLRLSITMAGLATLLGCGADSSTGPRRLTPRLAMDCLQYDPESCPDPGGGGGEAYAYDSYDYADGSAHVQVIVPGSPPPGPGVRCPIFYKALVPAYIMTDPPITVISSGWFYPKAPNNTVGRGRYAWPTGWWPEAGGGDREASIAEADATCSLIPASQPNTYTIDVLFTNFYGVTIKRPITGSGGGSEPGGGGGGGGTSNCDTEWVTVQIDSGNGWEDYWSGYATVCS
jgi:hypothetical protein